MVLIVDGVSIGAAGGLVGVPFTTVRGWWRQFRVRALAWWAGFAADVVELEIGQRGTR